MFRWIYGKSPLNAFVEKALHILKCAEPFHIFVANCNNKLDTPW